MHGTTTCVQIWLWNPHTIMIYETAPYGVDFPANNLAKLAREQGMDAVVKTCFNQIREAVDPDDKLNIEDPDWARLKTWNHGALIPGWKGDVSEDNIDEFVDKVARPFGPGVPLFYGNSEMSKNGDLHGWAEGALEMVEDALPELMRKLGVDDFTEYDPKVFVHTS